MALPRSFLRRDGTLRALTLWPEWVWAIVNLDKRLENRTWKLPIGEWLGLHAGAYVGGRKGSVAEAEGWIAVEDMAVCAGWVTPPGLWRTHEFRKDGRIVQRDPMAPLTSMIHGIFRVKSYTMGDPGGWHVRGLIGNTFDYIPLAEPVACKGAQQLWAVPADVVSTMRIKEPTNG